MVSMHDGAWSAQRTAEGKGSSVKKAMAISKAKEDKLLEEAGMLKPGTERLHSREDGSSAGTALRKLPDAGAPFVNEEWARAAHWERCAVLETQGAWSRVATNTGLGWLESRHLHQVPPRPKVAFCSPGPRGVAPEAHEAHETELCLSDPDDVSEMELEEDDFVDPAE